MARKLARKSWIVALQRRLGRTASKRAAERHPLRRCFDQEYYLESNPDINAAGVRPLEHFLDRGWQEGRNPHPDFDVSYYLETNLDVAMNGENPFHHFITHGWREGRQPSADSRIDLLAHIHAVEQPDLFNPFNYLIRETSDRPCQDWSQKIDEVAAVNLDEAIQLCVLWAERSEDGQALPRMRLGRLLIKRGDFPEAAREFEGVAAAGLTQPWPLLDAAECWLRAGDWGRFEGAVDRLINLDQHFFRANAKDWRVYSVRAFQLFVRDHQIEALAAFDRLTAEQPDYDLAFLGRGFVLRSLGSSYEALRDFLIAHRLNPYLEQAADALDQERRRFIPNVSEFTDPDKILEAPTELSPWLEAAVLLATGAVERCFDVLSGVSPDGLAEHAMLACAYEEVGNFGGALAILQQTDPDPYPFFRTLQLAEGSGLRDFSGLEIQRSELLMATGQAMKEKGCFRAAAECFQRAANDRQLRPAPLIELAACLLQLAEYEQAETVVRQVLETDPDSGPANVVMGSICAKYKRRDEVVAHYKKAIAVEPPPDPDIFSSLAFELDRAGDRRQAVEILEHGLEIYVTDSELSQHLVRLDSLQRLDRLSERLQTTSQTGHEEFLELLRSFIASADEVIGRDLAECRVAMDRAIRRGENYQLHELYGDLLVRGGNKFDALGYYEQAHEIAAREGRFGEGREIVKKIIAALEQLELYQRCLPFLQQYVHGHTPAQCPAEYRRIACYNAMLGNHDAGRQAWVSLLR